MADSGVSTQNFLRLLLGGAQKGADVFQQRQTAQEQQAPDLMMALQQMMQRQKQSKIENAFTERKVRVDEAQLGINAMKLNDPSAGEMDVAGATGALPGIESAINASTLQPEVKAMLIANSRAKAAVGNAPTIGSEGFQPLVSARVAKTIKDEEMAGKRLEFINTLMQGNKPITPKDRVMAANLGITDLDKVAGRDIDPLVAIDAMLPNISPEEKTVRKMIGDAEFSDVTKMTRSERWAYTATVYIETHPDLSVEQLQTIKARLDAMRKMSNAGE
jgi:hypothetical protein